MACRGSHSVLKTLPGQLKRRLKLGRASVTKWQCMPSTALHSGIFAVSGAKIKICNMVLSTTSSLSNASNKACHLCQTRSNLLARHSAKLSRSTALKPFLRHDIKRICIIQARTGEIRNPNAFASSVAAVCVHVSVQNSPGPLRQVLPACNRHKPRKTT